jgi:quinol monooxygenase YgiN
MEVLMMIRVVAKSTVKPDKAEEYIKLASALAAETRKEAGCISYGLYQDVKNSTVFSFIEEWESQEALDKHMKAKHFVEIVPKMGQLRDGDSEVNVYKAVV